MCLNPASISIYLSKTCVYPGMCGSAFFVQSQDSAVKNVLAGIVQYCTDQIKSNQLNYMIIKLRKNGDLVDHFAGAFL